MKKLNKHPQQSCSREVQSFQAITDPFSRKVR